MSHNVISSCTRVPVTTCHHVSQHISPRRGIGRWNASCGSWIMSSIAQCFVPAAAAAAVNRDNGIKLAQLPILTLRPDPRTIVSISRLSVQVQMGALSTQLHRIFIKGGQRIRCPLSWQTPS